MARIIKQGLTLGDFNAIVNEFIFNDRRITLKPEPIVALRECLIQTGPAFLDVFETYFVKTNNKRYDDLTSRMEHFVNMLVTYHSGLGSEGKKAFMLFWNEVAGIIKTDQYELNDQYLTNSCNYFIHELSGLH